MVDMLATKVSNHGGPVSNQVRNYGGPVSFQPRLAIMVDMLATKVVLNHVVIS